MANGAPYFETSAKTGANVKDMFDYLLETTRKAFANESQGQQEREPKA